MAATANTEEETYFPGYFPSTWRVQMGANFLRGQNSANTEETDYPGWLNDDDAWNQLDKCKGEEATFFRGQD